MHQYHVATAVATFGSTARSLSWVSSILSLLLSGGTKQGMTHLFCRGCVCVNVQCLEEVEYCSVFLFFLFQFRRSVDGVLDGSPKLSLSFLGSCGYKDCQL